MITATTTTTATATPARQITGALRAARSGTGGPPALTGALGLAGAPRSAGLGGAGVYIVGGSGADIGGGLGACTCVAGGSGLCAWSGGTGDAGDPGIG